MMQLVLSHLLWHFWMLPIWENYARRNLSTLSLYELKWRHLDFCWNLRRIKMIVVSLGEERLLFQGSNCNTLLFLSLLPLLTHPRILSPALEVLHPVWDHRSLEQRMMTLTLSRSRWEWLVASAILLPMLTRILSFCALVSCIPWLVYIELFSCWIKN